MYIALYWPFYATHILLHWHNRSRLIRQYKYRYIEYSIISLVQLDFSNSFTHTQTSNTLFSQKVYIQLSSKISYFCFSLLNSKVNRLDSYLTSVKTNETAAYREINSSRAELTELMAAKRGHSRQLPSHYVTPATQIKKKNANSEWQVRPTARRHHRRRRN